jgi:NitT/TauT family transport system substrate-binding protein
MMDDPMGGDDFVRFVPEGSKAAAQVWFNMYAKLVYPGQRSRARSTPTGSQLQEFYVAKGFIQKATPVDELYTNAFIK